jgi:hypothetical protein
VNFKPYFSSLTGDKADNQNQFDSSKRKSKKKHQLKVGA